MILNKVTPIQRELIANIGLTQVPDFVFTYRDRFDRTNYNGSIEDAIKLLKVAPQQFGFYFFKIDNVHTRINPEIKNSDTSNIQMLSDTNTWIWMGIVNFGEENNVYMADNHISKREICKAQIREYHHKLYFYVKELCNIHLISDITRLILEFM